MENLITKVKIQKVFKASLLVLMVLLLGSCGSDDDQSSNAMIEGGEVSRYQLVSLEIDNIPGEIFEGKVNENTVSIVKSDDNIISLLIDEKFEIGENILDLPSINKKIRFSVKNTVLSNSVDETLADLSTNFNNYAGTLSNDNNTAEQTYVINAIENYNSTIQQLSPKDKELVALTYQANKEFFDNLYQTDYTIPKSGNDFSNLTYKQLAKNWALATVGAGSATFLAVATFSTIPIVTLPLAIAAITLWEISHDLGVEAINRTEVLYDQFQFDELISNPLPKNNGALEFISEVPRQITFKSTTRSINSSDSDNDNTTISSIFSTNSEFNKFIDKLNEVIAVVNDIPFTDIPLIDSFNIPSQSQSEDIDVNQDIFANISFNIDNSNLNLTDVSFENDFLNMTISIIDDTDVEDFIEASINYDFQNDTNDLTGSFPVKVLKEETTFTDPRDGQVYQIVQIGNQFWFAENLNYTTGISWCYDDGPSNCVTYGRLYDWQTALTACPDGWHLPSDAEWSQLSNYLGGDNVSGNKMKSTTTDWSPDSGGATNSSGFSGLPSGYRLIINDITGEFVFSGKTVFGRFWSATNISSTDANYRWLLNIEPDLLNNSMSKTGGNSCRCIKD